MARRRPAVDHEDVFRPLPLRRRARIAVALLAVAAAVQVALAVLRLEQLYLAWEVRYGAFVSEGRFHQVGSWLVGLEQIDLPIEIAAGAAFIAWLWRAYGNAAAGGPTDGSPRWVVAGWFVPLANLVVPFRVVGEAWRRTTGQGSSRLVSSWWALYVVSGIGGSVVSGFVFPPSTTLDGYERRALALATTHALGLVAAALAIVLVRRLTERQAAAPAPA